MELLQGNEVNEREVNEAKGILLHTQEFEGMSLTVFKAYGRGCYYFLLCIDEDAARYYRWVENSYAIRNWEREEEDLRDFVASWFNDLKK